MATEPVTREELAEALREIVNSLQDYADKYYAEHNLCSGCMNYVDEQLTKSEKLLSRLDAEQEQEQHCEMFTTIPGRPRDCSGDGHYECHECGLLDPDSLMNAEQNGGGE